jgi:mannose-6-phosphate isomerase-like protein (cupin superfamily)
MSWQTRRCSSDADVIAPDGSEIRLLSEVRGASMVLCTLRPGQTTQAVEHRTVEEMWYCLTGAGELWRAADHQQVEVVSLEPGVAVSIPLGVRFQFRCTSPHALELVIATAPAWPGNDEAIPVQGSWQTSV